MVKQIKSGVAVSKLFPATRLRSLSPCGPIILLVMLAMIAPARAAQWTMVDPSPRASVAAHSVRGFVADVAKMSGGSLVLSAAPLAAGTAQAALLTELAAGRLPVALVPLSALEATDAVVAMDRVPYLASNFIDGAKLWRVLRPYVRDLLKSKGITLLYAVPSPPPSPLSRKPLMQMSAWRDSSVVLNAPAISGFARAVGSSTVAGGSARERLGADSDAVVFQSAPISVADKAWEYATNFLPAPAWFPKQLIVASSRQLAALSAMERDAVFDAADAARRLVWAASEQATGDGVQKLRDYGIKTREPSVDVLIRLEALGRGLLFQWSDGAGEIGAQLVEAYYAIR
jgi:TRAP-type C4-dicarboxylate transport system substrate-binding protein